MCDYTKKIFAKNLLYYLDKNQLKQIDLCSLLNVSKSTVSQWCSGKKMPRMNKIEQLANLFNIKKSDLVDEKDSELTEEHQLLIDLYDANTPGARNAAMNLLKNLLSNGKDEVDKPLTKK